MKRLGVVLMGMAISASFPAAATGQNGVPAPAPDKLEAITAFFTLSLIHI